MGFQLDRFKEFLLQCSRENVADITVQSGDYLWGRHNRTYIRLSDRPIQVPEMELVISGLYATTGLAELMSGKALDWRASAEESREVVRYFRANAVKARVGRVDGAIQLTLRSIPSLPPTLDQLGIEKELVDNLFPTYGLVLVVGTTGSGKSTLLASANRWRLERRRDTPVKIITFEDPIEFVYSGLAEGTMPEPAQTEIGPGAHLTSFERAGPNAMRRAADVIVMGEMRDRESVDAGFEMALTGHATYSTLHCDTPSEAIDRIISFYPTEVQQSAANKLLSTLRLIVAQKLARTKDGKVIAFRSWKVFDQTARKHLASLPFERLADAIRNDCAERETDFNSCVKRAFEDDRISFATARNVAGLTVEEAEKLLGVTGDIDG